MSSHGTENETRDQTLTIGDRQTPQCPANCPICKIHQYMIIGRERSRSPVSRPRSPLANNGLDLSYNMNSGPSISSTTNYPLVQSSFNQSPLWTSTNQTVENQEAGHSSSSSSSARMASQPKTRRRIRTALQRTPSPPVAVIDLTTDTPTPPPPTIRTRTTVRERNDIRPSYFYDLEENQDFVEQNNFLAENNFQSHQGSYTSFSNEENLGGLFHPVSPLIVNETSNNTYLDQSVYEVNNVVKSTDEKLFDPAPAINDTNSSETILLSCPICFEELRPTRKPTSTKCGHVFCEECLDATLIVHKKCPKCNAPIKRKSCIRLFL